MDTKNVTKDKTVFTSPLFSIREENIKLKTGRIVTHHNVYRLPTVVVFPISEKKELYLIKQYRYMFKATVLEAVAGFIDPLESPLQAAKRELKEETGIQANTWEEIARLEASPSVIRAQTHLFLASDVELGEPHLEEEEEIELVKLPLEKAVEKVLTGEINTAASVVGILMIERMFKKK